MSEPDKYYKVITGISVTELEEQINDVAPTYELWSLERIQTGYWVAVLVHNSIK